VMDEDTNHKDAKHASYDRCVSVAECARKKIGWVAHAIDERSWRGKENEETVSLFLRMPIRMTAAVCGSPVSS
jgi:hypothetical protein